MPETCQVSVSCRMCQTSLISALRSGLTPFSSVYRRGDHPAVEVMAASDDEIIGIAGQNPVRQHWLRMYEPPSGEEQHEARGRVEL